MSTIDWDVINGTREREVAGSELLRLWAAYDKAELERPLVRAKPPKFTQDQIDAALAKLADIPPLSEADPDKLSTFWPMVTKFGLADLDFRRVEVKDVTLADLSSSNGTLSRQKLEEHIESPGQAAEVTPFDKYPIVLQSKKKQTIIDGQHRLAALMLLGATSWPVYLVPK